MNKAAQALGRLGGLAKSKAKTAAVRANGRLGGRPKKPKAHVRRPNDKMSHRASTTKTYENEVDQAKH